MPPRAVCSLILVMFKSAGKAGFVANGAIRAAGLTPWTRRNFARWMFEDYPRAALFTPDRWRRQLFTPAGAFT